MSPEFSREVALRIGLAIRSLPGVSVSQFVHGLASQLGWPLTETELARITVAQLKQALCGEFESVEDVEERVGVPRLKEVVEIMWGPDREEADLPAVAPYAARDMPGSIRVAVASDNGEEMNAHFGSCRRYLIYQLSVREARLVALRSARGADEAEDSSAFRAELIQDCHVLFVQSIGGPAAAKVINAGIYPLKFPDGGPARRYLGELQQKMASAPPPWLAKAMDIPVEDRIRFRVEVAT